MDLFTKEAQLEIIKLSKQKSITIGEDILKILSIKDACLAFILLHKNAKPLKELGFNIDGYSQISYKNILLEYDENIKVGKLIDMPGLSISNILCKLVHKYKLNLAIVGSRNFTDSENNYDWFSVQVNLIIEEWGYNKGNIESIISGGCQGVDKLAEKYAKENDINLVIFPANWSKFGKKAGPLRNTEIVNECNSMIAFPSRDSIGTFDSIKKCSMFPEKLLKVVYCD